MSSSAASVVGGMGRNISARELQSKLQSRPKLYLALKIVAIIATVAIIVSIVFIAIALANLAKDEEAEATGRVANRRRTGSTGTAQAAAGGAMVGAGIGGGSLLFIVAGIFMVAASQH